MTTCPNARDRHNYKDAMKYSVKATHTVKATREFACEVYPDVFVTERGRALSPYAGQAQFGHPCEPLPDETDTTFEVTARAIEAANRWAESLYHPERGRLRPRDT
ncbi:hypothetical protein [Prescottella equi]|uniref:hypothetical protein n=1 Tax=Rhodococcus hoagii TaxID=43767 RepID=UPI001F27FE73|nr:hypothetical protein [Prescottella equi]